MKTQFKIISKIFIAVTSCFLFYFPGFAQQWSGNNNTTDPIYRSGSVGIGTASPTSKLDVNGNIQISNSSIPMGLMTEVGGTSPLLNMSVNFREPNKTDTYRGAAFRIDTRAGIPLFQWLKRSEGSSVEEIPMVLTESGSLGIGNMSPSSKLDVNGDIQISNAGIPMGLITEVGGTSPLLNMSVNFREPNKTNAYRGAAVRIDTRPGVPLFQWLARPEGSAVENMVMALTENGSLGIGTYNPGSFKLAVEGKIGAREINVIADNPWPDYVFQSSYKLIPLSKLESYVKENKHLPDVPSAAEIEKNGLNLGEMNALLLKKIEELTLYVIDLKKELEKVQEAQKSK